MTQRLQTKLNNALLYQYVFYKHFYKFIFLHKPLCPKYKSHTIKIFDLYVCKSCLLLYSGFITTLCVLIPKIKNVYFSRDFFLAAFCSLIIFIATYPSVYSKLPKFTKNIVRFLDGVMIAGVFTICFKINLLTGLASILAFITIRNIYNKRRTGKKVCENCEYLGSNKTCVGYEKQKEALLKIEEEYSNIRMKQINKKEAIND